MAAFQKSLILTKFWVWERCPIRVCIKKSVVQGFHKLSTLSKLSKDFTEVEMKEIVLNGALHAFFSWSRY